MTVKTTAFFRPHDGQYEVTFTAAGSFAAACDWERSGCGVGVGIVHNAYGNAR